MSPLLTQTQLARLLDNGRLTAAVNSTPGEIDFHPVLKLFNPWGAGTWLLTEIEPDDHDIAWGLCDLGMGEPEFETVSLSELASIKGRLGLGIERDRYFKAVKPISAYIAEAALFGLINT